MIEFSDRLDVECKKTRKVKDDSDNISWRSWKRGVDIYCDGEDCERCEGGFGSKEFNYGHFNFTGLDIQLQRLKLQLHFFFREELWARNSNLGVLLNYIEI